MPPAASSPIKLSIQNKLNIGVAKMTALSQYHTSSSQPVSGNFHFFGNFHFLGNFQFLGSAGFTGESKRQRCSYPGLKPNGVGGKSHTGFSVLWIISVSGEEPAQSTLWTCHSGPGFWGNLSFKSKHLLCKCKLSVRVREGVMPGGYGSFIP